MNQANETLGQLELMRDKYRKMIDDRGYALIGINAHDEDVPFAYTVGLSRGELPEVLLLGNFHPKVADCILNSVATVLIGFGVDRGPDAQTLGFYNGMRLDDLLTDADDNPVLIKLVAIDKEEAERNYLIQAEPILRDHLVGVVQILTADGDGRFPDEEGYDFDNYPQIMAAAKVGVS